MSSSSREGDRHSMHWGESQEGDQTESQRKGAREGEMRRVLAYYLGVTEEANSKYDLDNMSQEQLENLVLRTGHCLETIGAIQRLPLFWDAGGGGAGGAGGGDEGREQRVLQVIGFTTRLYKVPMWYQEVVEMLRRVLMTSALALLYPSPDRLASVAMAVNGAFFLHNLINRPYISPLHQAVSTQAQLTELLLLFTVVVSQRDAAAPQLTDGAHFYTLRAFLEILTVAMMLFTVVLPIAYVVVRRCMRIRIVPPLGRNEQARTLSTRQPSQTPWVLSWTDDLRRQSNIHPPSLPPRSPEPTPNAVLLPPKMHTM